MRGCSLASEVCRSCVLSPDCSIAGVRPQYYGMLYSMTKAALIMMTKSYALELGPKGVRVNSITPGFFPAEQNRKLLFNDDGSPTTRTKSIWAHTPMGRFGEANELIGAALFLASAKASSFVTGSDIRVDGGFLAQTI